MQDTLRNRRFAGAAGLAGALLFFRGDMLFYGHWGAGDTFKEGMLTVLRQGSLTRLFTGGLLGPVAACLCIIGVCHTCESGLISGSVVYGPEPLEKPADGNLLVCCSKPTGDVVIDL